MNAHLVGGGMTDGLRRFSRRWLERPATSKAYIFWAFGLVVVATVARFLLLPVFGLSFPYVTYFPAVVLAAALGGFRGAALGVGAALICAWYFFLPSQNSFELRSSGDALSLVVFAFNVSAGAICAALMRFAIVRVAVSDHRNELLVMELNHRVNNNLGAVLSIARQSAGAAASVPEFLDAFEGRVTAMARSHRLLTRSEWNDIEVEQIVRETLAPYDAGAGDAIAVHGPRIVLGPTKAVSLGMVLNELATGAARRGVLSEPGRITVSWAFVDGVHWRLLWAEQGSASSAQPLFEGLGERLVQRLVKGDLEGSINVGFPPSGLTAELTFRP